MRPDLLLPLLAIPGTDRPPRFQAESLVGEVPHSGWLLDEVGEAIARLDGFRFDFLHFDRVAETARAAEAGPPTPLAPHPALVAIDRRSARIEARGGWFWIGDWLLGHHGDAAGAELSFTSAAPRIRLVLHAHGWSGIARVTVDGEVFAEPDLYHQHAGIPHLVEVPNPARRPLRIALAPTGRRHPESQGRQVLIEEILEEAGPPVLPDWRKPAAVNRGGAFGEKALALLAGVPEDGVLLDIGGGRRQIADPRYLNLEYTQFSEPDLFGDGLALPFRDGVIDAIHSSAVLEHVRDPHRFAAEVWRVLRPGGRILVNAAFMQPIHSEGQHFFNHTPYAMEMLFERFADRRVWWGGSLHDAVAWMMQVAKVPGRADPAEYEAFLASLRRFSDMVTYDRLMYVAGDVWLEGRKPG
ncbi:methyltransferase domain-containing protein [Belnapia sp. T6]|uniref:Methyltransferase domain-containing protein n=1 Tax=Belnapia mucosa TaxID=2804532 RepID=A0ABS1V6L7_9PROT|nr:class I SAM-dependent methyltransferase [Belnapia mucosa]MBL6457316.1 methyltransferase domain-containing protein [Belnapia mucosa]